jgi:hypothetical protein
MCAPSTSVATEQRPSRSRLRLFSAFSLDEVNSTVSDQAANTGRVCGSPPGRSEVIQRKLPDLSRCTTSAHSIGLASSTTPVPRPGIGSSVLFGVCFVIIVSILLTIQKQFQTRLDCT